MIRRYVPKVTFKRHYLIRMKVRIFAIARSLVHIRLCCDYRPLNEKLVHEATRFRQWINFFNQLNGAKDLQYTRLHVGLPSIKVGTRIRPLTAIRSHLGIFEFSVMIFLSVQCTRTMDSAFGGYFRFFLDTRADRPTSPTPTPLRRELTDGAVGISAHPLRPESEDRTDRGIRFFRRGPSPVLIACLPPVPRRRPRCPPRGYHPELMVRRAPPRKSNEVVGDPVTTALDSRCVPPSAARGALNLNTDAPAPPARHPDEPSPSASPTRERASNPRHAVRTPEGRAREGECARRCPSGAPDRPARRGAQVPGGPVPSTLFVIHGIPHAIGCCASGYAEVRLSSAGSLVGHKGWHSDGESFVYLIIFTTAHTGFVPGRRVNV